jgi:hypothetical protein
MVLVALASAVGFAADKKPLTNADVMKMVKAELPESTVIAAIEGNPVAFDSSVDALIELKSGGVSPKIIEAMLTPRHPIPKEAPAPTAPPPIPMMGPGMRAMALNDVILFDGEKQIQMYQSAKDSRLGGLMIPIPGFSGFHYWQLRGAAAKQRVASPLPRFRVALAGNIRAEDAIVLTRWEPRSNGSREIKVKTTKGVTLNSVGISSAPVFPLERVIPMKYAELTESLSAPGARIVEVTPKDALVPGEYALIVSDSEPYDFGIEK